MTNAEAGSRTVQAGDAAFSYLDAGSSPPLVLLHGIGSAAGSFRCQVETLCPRLRVIAWDAPGYGASTRLATEHPHASHYAAALDRWLGALGIDRCHMLGHSLGTLIAARFAAEQPKRVLSLTLASIASGHGRLPPAERQRLLAQRLDFARGAILLFSCGDCPSVGDWSISEWPAAEGRTLSLAQGGGSAAAANVMAGHISQIVLSATVSADGVCDPDPVLLVAERALNVTISF